MTLITNNTNNLSTIKPRKVQSTIFNYQVVTDDGYKVEIYRIPGPRY